MLDRLDMADLPAQAHFLVGMSGAADAEHSQWVSSTAVQYSSRVQLHFWSYGMTTYTAAIVTMQLTITARACIEPDISTTPVEA